MHKVILDDKSHQRKGRDPRHGGGNTDPVGGKDLSPLTAHSSLCWPLGTRVTSNVATNFLRTMLLPSAWDSQRY
jgi:hypothetical protein